MLGGHFGAGEALSVFTARCSFQAKGCQLSPRVPASHHGESRYPENLSTEAEWGLRGAVTEE